MIQIIEQTHEEKAKMYMKLPKKELIEMLIECNRFIDDKLKELKELNLDSQIKG